MKETIEYSIQSLEQIELDINALLPHAKQIRNFYKYQNSDTDSVSESYIVGLNNLLGDICGLRDELEELLAFLDGEDD